METRWPSLARLTLLLLLTIASFAPLLCLMLSMAVAGALGCRVDEADAYPCRFAGRDIGEWLNGGFVLGWLTILTWPGMLVCLVLWSVRVTRRFSRRRV